MSRCCAILKWARKSRASTGRISLAIATVTANARPARGEGLALSRVRSRARRCRLVCATCNIYGTKSTSRCQSRSVLSLLFFYFLFLGYRLRETDNRINRTKHRQQPLNRNKQQADTALTERNAVLVGNTAVAPQSLSMKELRRKGLTKYDAELLIAQGCRFSDINQQQPAINNGENILQTRPHPSAIATSVTRSLRNKQLCKFDGNTGDGSAIKNTQSLRASR